MRCSAVETARAISRGEREPSASLRGPVRGAFGSLLRRRPRICRVRGGGRPGARARRGARAADGVPCEGAADALDSGMLVARGRRMGFRHALLREAVYADLPEPRRASLHERWARDAAGLRTVGSVRRRGRGRAPPPPGRAGRRRCRAAGSRGRRRASCRRAPGGGRVSAGGALDGPRRAELWLWSSAMSRPGAGVASRGRSGLRASTAG